MTADEAVRLLGSVVPLLRFLGVRRAEIDTAAPGKVSALRFDPPALRPVPEGLYDLLVTASTCLVLQPAGDGEFLALDADESTWWQDTHEVGPTTRRQRLKQLPDRSCPVAFGLSEFLAGVWYAPLGQPVLADWLEERSGPSAFATALRASAPEPIFPYSEGPIVYDAFRWRWLEPDVVCYFSRCTPQSRQLAGFVLGLLHRSAPGAIPRRWARWLRDCEPARQFAAWMGVEVPDGAETEVW